jgi:hypothetical protein
VTYRHSGRAEEVGFELPPQFLELNVFRKSGIVDQHVAASVIARHDVYNDSDVQKFSDVERSGIDPVRHADLSRFLIGLCGRARTRRAATTAYPASRQFDGGEQSEAARAVGKEERSVPARTGRFRGDFRPRSRGGNVRQRKPTLGFAEFLPNMPGAMKNRENAGTGRLIVGKLTDTNCLLPPRKRP